MAEKLIVEIELVAAKNNKAFNDIERKSKESGKKIGKNIRDGVDAKGIKTSLAGIAKGFFGIALAAKALSSAMRTVGASFDNLRKFGRGLAEINTILPKNQKLTENATQSLVNFSKQFGTNQQEQARAFYNIVSAGVKGTAKQLDTLAISNKAAVAGLVDIDTAARVIVSSVNAYSKAGLTATQASDALFIAVREGQTTFGELADSVGNVTSIASNAGVSFAELAGSVAFVTKSGIKTDIAVTGLRQVFASVIKPSKEAADEAKRLGIEFTKVGVESKGLAGFLKEVQSKTKGSESSLAKLFGNIRALAPVLNIVNGDFEEYNRILKETTAAQGATAEAASIMAKELDFKISQTTSEFQALALNLITVLKPAFIEIVEAARFVGQTFNKVFRKDSSKELDVLNAKLGVTARQINLLQSDLETKREGFFSGLFGDPKEQDAYKNIQKQIDVIREKRKGLLTERGQLLGLRRSVIDKEIAMEKQTNAEIFADKLATDALSKALIQNTSEFIVEQESIKLDRLQELRDNDLISEQMLSEARIQLREQTQTQLNEIEARGLVNSSITFDSLADAFRVNSKKMKFTAIELAKTIQNSIGKGFGDAFQSVGMALRNGENAMDAFAASMGKMFANLASQAGDFYIAKGLALLADPATSASGGQMIAAGSGLKVLAGLLGGGGSSGASGSGAGGVSAQNNVADTEDLTEQNDVAEFTEQRNVQLVVEGSIFNTPETAKSLLGMLNDEFESTGSTLTGARLA